MKTKKKKELKTKKVKIKFNHSVQKDLILGETRASFHFK